MLFYVVANIAGGGFREIGMSGGDRIALACVKNWVKNGHKVKIFTGKSGQNIYDINDDENVCFVITSAFIADKFSYVGLLFSEILSLIGGGKSALKAAPLPEAKIIIYSASDFWPDAIPALMLKSRNPQTTWIAGFYQFAPCPWCRETPYKGKKWVIGTIYWLSQLPIYYLIKKFADYVFVTSEPDVGKFLTKKRSGDNIVVVRGGVETKEAIEYLNSNRVIPLDKRRYDAVFVGRLHYQKGVLELIDIWQLVCQKKPESRLAIIGIGTLEDKIKKKIKTLELNNNIELLGFKDGQEKYEIFKQSKLVVHPATYDSGGMAAAEAMAWGLAGVSFDIEALKTYYPQGMLKTPCYDLEKFAENIVGLLENKELYERTRNEAICWARQWDWDKRAEEILQKIKVHLDRS